MKEFEVKSNFLLQDTSQQLTGLSLFLTFDFVTLLKDFYQKVQEFAETLSSEAESLSECKKGCARCCYADLSVFEVEAQNIRDWYSHQDPESKEALKALWQLPLNEKENFFDEKVKSCVFLHQEACTIYEARPLICRTQGLPLQYRIEETFYQDICPLNEKILDVVKEKEILNLDKLNTILSQIEKADGRNEIRPRVRLADLREKLKND